MTPLLRTLIEWLQPEWRQDRTPDPNHPHRRRFTACYQRKRGLVKNLWIGSGCLMLINPVPPFVLLLALVTAFCAFMVLDETG